MAEFAAVLRTIGAPLEIEEISLAPIATDQVRVRIMASGVCHSDLSLQNGDLPFMTGSVLGHEGAGVIEEVGAAVSHVAVGDHVAMAWTPACGECWYCQAGERHLCDRAISDTYAMPYATDSAGKPLYATMGLSSFATATNCLGRAVIKIDPSIPFDVAALVGCGVATGAGAAMNTVPASVGSSVAVFGLGGVGLAAMLGAVVQGASTVIAVDPVASRRELALAIGATDAVDPTAVDAVDAIKALTDGRGVDIAYEVVGKSAVIDAAYRATRKGGVTCVVGAARPDDSFSLSPFDMMVSARSVVGCQYGSTVPGARLPAAARAVAARPDATRPSRDPPDRSARGQLRVRRPDIRSRRAHRHRRL